VPTVSRKWVALGSFWIDSQVAMWPDLEGHELPADGGGVASLAGLVPPAAADGVLGEHDVIERKLGGGEEPFVVRHAVGFAEDDGARPWEYSWPPP